MCFPSVGKYNVNMWKKKKKSCIKPFCGSGGSCVKSDKLPQVMFGRVWRLQVRENENEIERKTWGCEVRNKRAYQISVTRPSSLLARGYVSCYERNTPAPQATWSGADGTVGNGGAGFNWSKMLKSTQVKNIMCVILASCLIHTPHKNGDDWLLWWYDLRCF